MHLDPRRADCEPLKLVACEAAPGGWSLAGVCPVPSVPAGFCMLLRKPLSDLLHFREGTVGTER